MTKTASAIGSNYFRLTHSGARRLARSNSAAADVQRFKTAHQLHLVIKMSSRVMRGEGLGRSGRGLESICGLKRLRFDP